MNAEARVLNYLSRKSGLPQIYFPVHRMRHPSPRRINAQYGYESPVERTIVVTDTLLTSGNTSQSQAS